MKAKAHSSLYHMVSLIGGSQRGGLDYRGLETRREGGGPPGKHGDDGSRQSGRWLVLLGKEDAVAGKGTCGILGPAGGAECRLWAFLLFALLSSIGRKKK